MALKHVNPNRMELSRLKKKLATAVRGHKLLKDKQDELMRQFLELVVKNYDLRENVENKLKQTSGDFALARACMDEPVLETALLASGEKITVEAKVKKVMSVPVPQFEIRSKGFGGANFYPYGLAFTSVDLDDAVKNLSDVIPDMLKLAEVEKTCQLMSIEIEKTRRRVNALEHVVIPETREQIRYIKMKLEENERSSQVRLIKVKDMILAKAYKYDQD